MNFPCMQFFDIIYKVNLPFGLFLVFVSIDFDIYLQKKKYDFEKLVRWLLLDYTTKLFGKKVGQNLALLNLAVKFFTSERCYDKKSFIDDFRRMGLFNQ